MGTLVDGKAIAERLNHETAEEVKRLKSKGVTPKLAVILVGDNKPSHLYVKMKKEVAAHIGIACDVHTFPETVSEADLIQHVHDIQKDSSLSGIIVQLPLPQTISTENVIAAIHPELDVDCLTQTCLTALESGQPIFIPPTPGSVLSVLEHLKINLKGKKVAIFGRGKLVGKPLASLFLHAGAEVAVIHSKTENPTNVSRSADIIVSGIGKKHIITKDMVKPGAVVIDAGTMVEDGKAYGDVDTHGVLEVASAVTPSPGGVGPITIARLLMNTVIAARRNMN